MMRVGQGWDIHRLVVGRPLRLGGITIPSERGLLGHSDGDVVQHALCDALLGALGERDIGTQFPDTDPRYHQIDSSILLQQVTALVHARQCAVTNVDITILAEQPRLAPQLPAMRERIATLMGVAAERISVKAKSMEGLGPIGQGEAIAALVVLLISGGDQGGPG